MTLGWSPTWTMSEVSFPALADTEHEAARAGSWKDVHMPRAHPPEFRQRAVELARLREKPVAKIAEDLGIAESCLRNSIKQADVDDGGHAPDSTDERAELVAAPPGVAGGEDGGRDLESVLGLLRSRRPPDPK